MTVKWDARSGSVLIGIEIHREAAEACSDNTYIIYIYRASAWRMAETICTAVNRDGFGSVRVVPCPSVTPPMTNIDIR